MVASNVPGFILTVYQKLPCKFIYVRCKDRSVVVVSRYAPAPQRALIIYVALTTQNRNSPYEVMLANPGFFKLDSTANVQGLASLPKVRLERRVGELPDDIMHKIKRAITFALDL
ncbi:MAG TPA: type II toxin-antitoxin system PemK/MazF family toxin [Nitrospirae bacterium]|nr:type II toxin-antitoxin system PemK/MazF family toxin [Nitrospirota bacterium]